MTIFTAPVVSPIMTGVGKAFLFIMRWKVIGELPEERPIIAIIAPHTSNWDFVLFFAAALSLPINVRWIGKHTIFRWPFKTLFVWMGGTPVDRTLPTNIVDQAAAAVRANPDIVMGLSPEGTRSKVDHWKTGFYRIAVGGNAPIFLAGIDFPSRTVTILETFWPTGDVDKDITTLQDQASPFRGRYPEKQFRSA